MPLDSAILGKWEGGRTISEVAEGGDDDQEEENEEEEDVTEGERKERREEKRRKEEEEIKGIHTTSGRQQQPKTVSIIT